MNTTKAAQFLSQTATLLRRGQAKIDRLDGKLVEQDIAARREEALIGYEFAKQVDRIETALKTIGSNLNVDQWCKQNCGVDIRTMRRRKRLYRNWREFEAKRRELGACGQTGLMFAVSLIQEQSATVAMIGRDASVRSVTRTRQSPTYDGSRCQFVTGGALTELPKLPAKSVNVIVTSPPYWPAKRAYGGKGIGFEKTLDHYIRNLVGIFHEAHRVLRDDGTLWLSIDDSYQDGDLLFIPSRLGMAMQDDGWICRSEIIWSKKGGGRPDSVNNRPIKEHEKVLMFAKQRNGYHYDGDHIRVPLIRPYSKAGRKKPGLYRRDYDRTERVWGNPMGISMGDHSGKLSWPPYCDDAAGIGAPMLARVVP